MLTHEEKQQALSWYSQNIADLQTIAHHYGLTVEELKPSLKRGV